MGWTLHIGLGAITPDGVWYGLQVRGRFDGQERGSKQEGDSRGHLPDAAGQGSGGSRNPASLTADTAGEEIMSGAACVKRVVDSN